MKHLILAAGCLLCLSAAARAELDPEVTTPYHLRVALQIADHPVFTDVFKQQVANELHDWMQAALGPMGDVAVIDLGGKEAAGDPLLKEVAARGLKALDSWKEMSDTKTHFVLIDYDRGQYQIQARQYDGTTGLATPLTRHAQTFDRSFVARTAARLIDLDFGLVGTVAADDQGPEVHVTLKGSGLKAPMGRWVKPGDVFAVSQVSERGGGTASFRLEWMVLQVTKEPDAGGVCLCRRYQRYEMPPRGSGFLGYRCLKLGTEEAPVRMRIVDDRIFAPIPALRVTVSGQGFDSQNRKEYVTNVDGLVQTDEAYRNLAFVRVLVNDSPRAQVPVAVFSDYTVVCPIHVTQESDTLSEANLSRRRWLGELVDDLSVAAQLFKDLGDLVKEKSHEAALDRAEKGLAELQGELKARNADLTNLRAAAQKANTDPDKFVASGLPLLRELQEREKRVETFIDGLKKTIAKEKELSAKGKEWAAKITQARLLEDQADYGRAIELYQQVLSELPEGADKPELQHHLDELQKEWQPKSKAHEAARDFIYNTWPNVKSVQELKDNLPKARAAFETCKAVGDRLSLRKLLLADVPLAAMLKQRIAAIRTQDNEEARREIKLIAEVSDALEKLHGEVSQYVQPPAATAAAK